MPAPRKLAAVCAAVSAVALSAPRVLADAPPGLYDVVDNLEGPALRQELHQQTSVLQTRKVAYKDAFAALAAAHHDPARPDEVLDIYLNRFLPIDDHSADGWTREHIWPKSHGFPDKDEGNPCNLPYSDLHLLFPAFGRYNSSRGDLPFDDCPGCTVKEVDGSPEAPNRRSSTAWEVWPGRRGDVARALFYVDLRYEGGLQRRPDKPDMVCKTPDLILCDDPGLIGKTVPRGADRAYMGVLSTLVRWSEEDKVDKREEARNDELARRQGNRNPFVDRPDLVARVATPSAWCGRPFSPFSVYLPTLHR